MPVTMEHEHDLAEKVFLPAGAMHLGDADDFIPPIHEPVRMCLQCDVSVDSLTASGALALQGMREYLMIFITSIIMIRFSQDAPAPRENTKLQSMLS